MGGGSPDLSAPAIAIEGLTKRYGPLVALDRLTLEVRPGEIFGFLGPNGAGKTTTVRILLDLLRPSAGAARIHGHDCQKDGLLARARVGYLPGEPGLPRDLEGREVLDLLARLEGRALDPARRGALLERLRFPATDLARRLRDYSTGMKRKLGIVQAFQSDPELLVLDEPTEGLDPAIQDAFWDLLRETKRRGRTVFMSSHILSEVERVCDRVALLRRGALALAGTVDDLRRHAARRVNVTFSREVEPPGEGWPEVYDVLSAEPCEWRLRTTAPLGALVARLSGLPVADLEVQDPHLEDVLLRFFREEA